MNKVKKIIPYVIGSLLVLLIFLITLKVNSLYPFGNYDLAKHDAIRQYKPFLYGFIMGLKNGNILSYSFSNALGNPTIFNYLYYLSSPINFVCLLFDDPNQMFFTIVLLKLVISSITMHFYAYKKTGNHLVATICSLCYVFSSWFLANYFQIMWLDAFMMFPILQYGLEELIHKNKVKIYIISLAYIMISNFYMAFIICLYVFVYYMFNIIIKKVKYSYKIRNFDLIFVSTLIVSLLCFWYIYSIFFSFMKIGIYVDGKNDWVSVFDIWGWFSSLFNGSAHVDFTSVRFMQFNIATSLIILISYIYFFVNSKISIGEKVKNLLILLFIGIILCFNITNFIANGLHWPAGFHYRYSFIITFYFINIFCDNYNTWNRKIDKRTYIIMGVILILLLVLFVCKQIEPYLFIFNIIFIISLFLWSFMYVDNKYHSLLLVGIIVLELFIACIYNIKNDVPIEYYEKGNNYNNYRNDNVYATSLDDLELNSNIYINENELTYFSSMQYIKSIDLLGNMGCIVDNKSTIAQCQGTDIFNIYFNVDGKYKLNKLFSVKKNLFDYSGFDEEMYVNQNKIVSLTTGIDDIYEKVNTEIELKERYGNYYVFNVRKDNYYFIKYNNVKSIQINDRLYKRNDDIINGDAEILEYFSFSSKYLKKGDIIKIEYVGDNYELDAYIENRDKIEKVYEYLKQGNIEYTYYSDSLIEGKINVLDDQLIFTSIPYDESWRIYVDGKRVQPIMILDSLIGIQCSPGEHTIKMEYKNDFGPSIWISLGTLFSIIGITVWKKIKKN